MSGSNTNLDKRLWLRLTEEDQRTLDVIAEMIASESRSRAMRYLIRQWRKRNMDASN